MLDLIVPENTMPCSKQKLSTFVLSTPATSPLDSFENGALPWSAEEDGVPASLGLCENVQEMAAFYYAFRTGYCVANAECDAKSFAADVDACGVTLSYDKVTRSFLSTGAPNAECGEALSEIIRSGIPACRSPTFAAPITVADTCFSK